MILGGGEKKKSHLKVMGKHFENRKKSELPSILLGLSVQYE